MLFNYIFGIISIILLVFIMYNQVKKGSLNLDEIKKSEHSTLISIILIFIGIIFLIYGSDLFVSSAIKIANYFKQSAQNIENLKTFEKDEWLLLAKVAIKYG